MERPELAALRALAAAHQDALRRRARAGGVADGAWDTDPPLRWFEAALAELVARGHRLTPDGRRD